MTRRRVHLWFFVSMTIVVAIIAFPDLRRTPVTVMLFLAILLLSSKEELQEHFNTPLPWSAVVGAFVLVAMLIAHALGVIDLDLDLTPTAVRSLFGAMIPVLIYDYRRMLAASPPGGR